MTQKNLLLIRALTAMNEVDSLKTLIQGLMAGETPQKQNVQGFSILIQFFLSNVSSTTRIDVLAVESRPGDDRQEQGAP